MHEEEADLGEEGGGVGKAILLYCCWKGYPAAPEGASNLLKSSLRGTPGEATVGAFEGRKLKLLLEMEEVRGLS